MGIFIENLTIPDSKIFTGYMIVCNDSLVPYDMPFLIYKDQIIVREELYKELKKLPKYAK